MYTILENQIRPDGVVNSIKETRNTFATAISFFYERCSKMSVTELYKKIYITVMDEALNVIDHKEIDTLYKADEDTKVEYVVDGEVVGFH